MDDTGNFQLKDYNAFRTEAKAKYFCEPTSASEIREYLNKYKEEKKLIIGDGCNLFFTKDFDGLIIHPQIKGIRDVTDDDDDDNEVYLEAMASEDWDELVQYCVNKGFSGLENLSYIPGTVGAAPVQNIGAYGAEVKDCIREVVALDMETGEAISFSNAECEFAYRNSIFKKTNKYIIVSVVFQLKKSYTYKPKYADLNKELEDIENPTIEEVRDAVIKIRKRKLPDHKELPNCGSFFKNPYIEPEKAETLSGIYPELPVYLQPNGFVKTSAAFLIDKAGFRGKRIGDVGTYPNQALIIVNYGTSNGNDIVAFMQEVQEAVFEEFGIKLEPEVRIL